MAKCGMALGVFPIAPPASPSESALLLCTKPHPVLCFWLRVLKSRSAKREAAIHFRVGRRYCPKSTDARYKNDVLIKCFLGVSDTIWRA
jgi:hypothetical protein